MKRRILCTILTLLMLVTLPFAFPRTAAAETLITAFTLTTSSNFRTPVAGEAIFFPSNLVSVSSTTPSGLASKLKIYCEWHDCTNDRTYDEKYITEGTFCPGEWELTVGVSITDSNYKLDYSNDFFSFSKTITLGGKTFQMTGRSSGGVRYKTSFTVDGTGVAPVFLNNTFTAKGNVGDVYSYQLIATGESPITYTKYSGTLPPGISLSSSGLLSGTFSGAGTYEFVVKASNRNGYALKTCTFTVKNVTRITNFTLAATSNFTTPSVGEAISFPTGKVYVSGTTPSGYTSALKIGYEWRDVTSGHTYDQVYNPTGTFTDGKWELTVIVSRVSDDYVLELSSWDEFTLGGKTFRMTGRSTTGARFKTTFYVGDAYEPITSAAVTITPPEIGQHPDYSPGLPANAPYYMDTYCDTMHINDVAWYGDGETAANFVFKENKIYTVRIYLTPKEGYKFTSSTTATINGIEPDVCELYNDQLKIQYSFPRLEPELKVIESVAVTITPPEVGMRPDYSPGLPADAPYYMGDYCDDYHINDVAWFGGTGETAETIVFREGRIYTLQLFLTAKDGYQFVNATTATVNGVVPNVVQMYEDQLKIQYTFPRLPYAFNGTVEFDPSDVQFKGTTPYVVYNGAYMTPRVIVKDVDGNVLDQLEYTVAYKENRNPGTAYVVVTIPGMNAVAHAFFKIYMPPTTATTVANTNDGIQITWEPVEGAAGYVIYRRAWNLTSSGWTTFERWNNTTETTWTDTKVYAGTRYQYGVKAYFASRTDPVSGATIGGAMDNYNLGVVGPLRTTVRITTRTLKSATGGTKQLTAKWGASSVFTGYQVQIATNAAFTKNVKTVKISNPKTYQTTIKNLNAKTTYYVRVRSYHVFEGKTYYGGWSNVLSAKTK